MWNKIKENGYLHAQRHILIGSAIHLSIRENMKIRWDQDNMKMKMNMEVDKIEMDSNALWWEKMERNKYIEDMWDDLQ